MILTARSDLERHLQFKVFSSGFFFCIKNLR